MRSASILFVPLFLVAGYSAMMPGALALESAATPAATETLAPSTSADPHRIAAHVAFLADDRLEGREAGTRGHELAALYVSSQFAQAGLQPAGDDGGWLQAVPLLRGKLVREGSQFVLERDGGRVEFRFEEEYLPGIGFDVPAWEVVAPLVYVGHGVVAPAFKHDDFAGVDVRGKIAVVVGGAPARFEKDARALYSSNREKQAALAERGAIGVIYIADPEREKNSPWARNAANWQRAGMRLRDAQGAPVDTFPQLQGSVGISVAAASKLFDGTPQNAEEVFRRIKAGEAQSFDLPGQARISGGSTLEALGSFNVVGVLRGSDPQLAEEFVVYTAHLDHLGIGAEVDGDGIHNGALDNALGSAVLMETARLAAALPRTARSQLFVAVTAEEKGLLGSDHFARNPGVAGRLVANLNMDMPVILTAHSDAITIGMEHSSLNAEVQGAAAELGITITADPFPEEVSFIRSDQFSFVRRGIPALSVKGGITSTVAGVDARQQLVDFRRQHYHQPSDGIGPGEIGASIHYPTAARLATLNLRMGQRIGAAAKAPVWNTGNFFGERFAAP
ncbi:MAG: M28 family peptidase [Pseudomarimonas sp.]